MSFCQRKSRWYRDPRDTTSKTHYGSQSKHTPAPSHRQSKSTPVTSISSKRFWLKHSQEISETEESMISDPLTLVSFWSIRPSLFGFSGPLTSLLQSSPDKGRPGLFPHHYSTGLFTKDFSRGLRCKTFITTKAPRDKAQLDNHGLLRKAEIKVMM